MDIRRITLCMALTIIGLSLWNLWQKEYPQIEISNSINQSAQEQNLLPGLSGTESTINNPESIVNKSIEPNNPNDYIHVKTDVLDVSIDLNQGNFVESKLLKYPLNVEDKSKPFILLDNNQSDQYVANSSIFTVTDKTIQTIDSHYSSANKNYELQNNENQLEVILQGKTEDGLSIKKKFIFKKGSYLVDVFYLLENKGQKEWQGYFNTQLLRSSPKEDKSSMFHVGSFTGASYSNPEKNHYKKISFADMNKSTLDLKTTNGWIAMQQHYFLSAWIPEKETQNRFYTRSINGNYSIGMISDAISIQPEQAKTVGAKLYIGPEITSDLKDIAPYLDLTVDYGILWFVSSLLFSLMKTIYNLVGNWGWSIVLVTLIIKLAFYRLSATSYKSMAGMRNLQPKLQALRERYGDDKAKISQATMELYKQEKVNPLGGCLPILIQIPVFIALYWVLLESVQLRQAPFIFWINDLASPDPYHVLPVIMGITMLIQQRLNPAPPDPVQAKVMMFLPVLFTGLFWSFPAGLVLYWIVNNTLSILQQWYITNKYSEDNLARKLIVNVK